jgi:hypothetical protein
MALVPVTEIDKTKKYYKYYERGIASPTPEQMEMIENCKGKLGEGLEIKDRNKLLEAGTFPEKFGYYPLEAGGLLVAGNVPMPDVTSDMLYWWWPWHGIDPFRYTIWDPEDHFGLVCNDEGIKRAKDDSIPMKEKTWGVVHTVQDLLEVHRMNSNYVSESCRYGI